jgi:hypothetical protein
VDLSLSPEGEFQFFVLGFFKVFFGTVRRRLHPNGRIRSSPSYPRSSGAPSVGGGRVEFWDLVHLCVCQCSYMFDCSDLGLHLWC